ncbi:heparan-alpha-glucosaminide N-acetyltransferase [Mesorhizobium sp. YIM 152430]|uniref:heparan-alpha-glucosaminide N-acetyltransferase n=1 Tax=Mesorhizobium sp. YIM 152430 TaxID=3031761 RepID=UPI0023D9D3E9|nr:heparan-alpha-glucosaminide N-acetyltransferase [Mesorhizobium sp. YIM 152430]MDF1600002.1 heparan-alpha-glucosaminide N-acetyltransferase [Mesorhizobium sp. YIM 152430]
MHSAPKNKSRIELIDAARGFALVAMAIYHFAWDLEFFGYATPGMTAVGGWRLFARSIASSFLFLVGFSLFLAHVRGVRWQPFWWRLLQVGGAAVAITLVTYFATPDAFIFFGILHHIAVASLVGLFFLRLPAVAVAALAAGVIVLPAVWRSDVFNGMALAWTGLASVNPRSNDFVPLFPWFGAVMLGMAAAKVALGSGWTERKAGTPLPGWTGPLQFAGRHSLAVYLLHQPILIGLIFLASLVVPPQAEEPRTGFLRACEAQCVQMRDAAFCEAYCGCVVAEIDGDARAGEIYTGAPSETATAWLSEIAAQCSISTDLDAPGEYE